MSMVKGCSAEEAKAMDRWYCLLFAYDRVPECVGSGEVEGNGHFLCTLRYRVIVV